MGSMKKIVLLGDSIIDNKVYVQPKELSVTEHLQSIQEHEVIQIAVDGDTQDKTMEYITLANTANFVDFGDLIQETNSNGTVNSPTRGITLGGSAPGGRINNCEFITISTLGDAADFGDLI